MESGESLAKRIFVALAIKCNQSMLDVLKKLRVSADRKEIDVYWTPKMNLHITLVFIGEVPVSEIKSVESTLTQAMKSKPNFSIKLHGLGAFPDEHHARTLWIGVRRQNELVQLQNHLYSQLLPFITQIESKLFLPHLTIGKLRKARSCRDLISPFVRRDLGELHVKSIILYESVNHGSHPVYRVVKEISLPSSV